MVETTFIHPQVIAEIKATLPSSYPIKRLTYLEMQQLRDQGLCLNCHSIDNSSHRYLVKRIILVLPNEDPNTEQQPMEIHASAAPKQLSSQDISLHALNHASDPHAMQLSTLFRDHQAISVIVEKNGNNELCSKNYKSFLAGLIQYGTSLMVHIITDSDVAMMRKCWIELLMNQVECKIKMTERKVLVFDPGGVSNGQIYYADKLHEAMFNKHEHNLFGVMLERNGRKDFEKVVFIFDPGEVLRTSKIVLMKECSSLIRVAKWNSSPCFMARFMKVMCNSVIIHAPQIQRYHRQLTTLRTRSVSEGMVMIGYLETNNSRLQK